MLLYLTFNRSESQTNPSCQATLSLLELSQVVFDPVHPPFSTWLHQPKFSKTNILVKPARQHSARAHPGLLH
jgi:hypothetical protein